MVKANAYDQAKNSIRLIYQRGILKSPAQSLGAAAHMSFDVIIVGGGSAGCIVAAELAKTLRVLLVENGELAEQNPETLTADGYKYAFANDRLLERFTEPQKHSRGRRWFAGTGRSMGAAVVRSTAWFTRAATCSIMPVRWDDLVPAFEALGRVCACGRALPLNSPRRTSPPRARDFNASKT